ncbi:Protein N-acetyltransferase, RimJ/RimL family [Cupriavidus sp. YR651]|uniref:GNAT family N-acetyltransferase n=1 Tax=Cupriavidus sp. YR651 TaxID=1855315 RepID=UPI0008884462|nr:GNAT family protein [Cupriavidus sp. YR651]SDD24599.1 Protein N-acetyltransferase, RimJ/RimL family [Cupriavidus sp. YR651]
MPNFVKPVTLAGRFATLEPLSHEHAAGLRDAAADGDLHTLWYTSVPSPDRMEADIARRLDLQTKDSMQPFAVRDADGRLAGMTTYMNIDGANRRVEIGSTWYARRVQRSGLNTECKLMLLRHAFETLDCIAVEFRTHWMNHQSRTAIARLGAKQDGVLRNHQRMPDGSFRDTVVFSIIASEWPTVRAHLQFQLDRPR